MQYSRNNGYCYNIIVPTFHKYQIVGTWKINKTFLQLMFVLKIKDDYLKRLMIKNKINQYSLSYSVIF